MKSINLKRYLVISFAFFVSLLFSQTKAQELDNSLLWQISGNGIQPSYIFGTFHLMPQEDFELKERVSQAFDTSAQIVLELDMDDPSMQSELMQNISMQEGITLDQLLSQADYDSLAKYMNSKLGMNIDQFKTVKPFFLASILIPTFIEGTPASYELVFVQRAIGSKKEILGLETPTNQAEVFDNISYEDQAKDLMEMITEQEMIEILFSTMIQYYKDEQVNDIYTSMVEYMDGENEEKYLLTERNKNWIPKIGEMAKDQPTFFAVGAGHLGGPNGVIKLLKEAGYKVVPVY